MDPVDLFSVCVFGGCSSGYLMGGEDVFMCQVSLGGGLLDVITMLVGTQLSYRDGP